MSPLFQYTLLLGLFLLCIDYCICVCVCGGGEEAVRKGPGAGSVWGRKTEIRRKGFALGTLRNCGPLLNRRRKGQLLDFLSDTLLTKWHSPHVTFLAQPALKISIRWNNGILPSWGQDCKQSYYLALPLVGKLLQRLASAWLHIPGRCPAPRAPAGINLPTSLRSHFISGHPAAAGLPGLTGWGFITFLKFQSSVFRQCPSESNQHPCTA